MSHCNHRLILSMNIDRCLQTLSKHLIVQQHVLEMIPVTYFTSKPSSYMLAVTTKSLHLLQQNKYKTVIQIPRVELITIAVFSNEIIVHTSQEDVRLQSFQNPKIIKNILSVRERIYNIQNQLTIFLEKQKSLEKLVRDKGGRFWSGWFGHKKEKEREKQIERQKGHRSQRTSFIAIQVTDKNFLVGIGQKIYETYFKQVSLLYINGTGGFFMNEMDYNKEELGDGKALLRHRLKQDMVLLKQTIGKCVVGDEGLRRYISSYRLTDCRQEIYFGIQTPKYFEIISPYAHSTRNAQEMLQDEHIFDQMDLLSVFYACMQLIQNQPYPLYALAPRHVLVGDRIKIAAIGAADPQKTNVDYLPPQDIISSLARTNEEASNVWRVGMLIFQLAFGCLPFPLQYLAGLIKNKRNYSVNFPIGRSTQFCSFLRELLVVQPQSRCKGQWRKRLFQHPWIRKTMR